MSAGSQVLSYFIWIVLFNPHMGYNDSFLTNFIGHSDVMEVKLLAQCQQKRVSVLAF